MSLNPLDSIFELGQSVIERIWPDANKRAEEMRKLEEIKQKGDLAGLSAYVQLMSGQIKTNQIEAAHKSLFVAGWRPFIGWTCGVAIAWSFIGHPLVESFLLWKGIELNLPVVDTNNLFELVMAMLGVGGLRTWEKIKGVSREK
jgi:hypothetical protein